MKSEPSAKMQSLAISNGELVTFAVRVVSKKTTGDNINPPHAPAGNKPWI